MQIYFDIMKKRWYNEIIFYKNWLNKNVFSYHMNFYFWNISVTMVVKGLYIKIEARKYLALTEYKILNSLTN